MKVASAPVSWGITEYAGSPDPRLFRRVLKEISLAGYVGTELGPYGFLPTDPSTLRQELERFQLQMVSAFVPLPLPDAAGVEEGLEELRKVAALLQTLGASLLVLSDAQTPRRETVAGRVTPADGLSAAEWKTLAESVARVAQTCGDYSLKVVFHHHVGCYVETPEELERFCECTDAAGVGLCLDTGHYTYGGGDPCEAVARYGSRIRHVHLKDVSAMVLAEARRQRWGFMEGVERGVFSPLGDGCVDFPRFFARLKEIHYDGWLVVEQDIDPKLAGSDESPALEWAQRSRRYLRERIGI